MAAPSNASPFLRRPPAPARADPPAPILRASVLAVDAGGAAARGVATAALLSEQPAGTSNARTTATCEEPLIGVWAI